MELVQKLIHLIRHGLDFDVLAEIPKVPVDGFNRDSVFAEEIGRSQTAVEFVAEFMEDLDAG